MVTASPMELRLCSLDLRKVFSSIPLPIQQWKACSSFHSLRYIFATIKAEMTIHLISVQLNVSLFIKHYIWGVTHEDELLTHIVSLLPWLSIKLQWQNALMITTVGDLQGATETKFTSVASRLSSSQGSAEGMYTWDTSPPKQGPSITHSPNTYWKQVYSEVLTKRFVLRD